MSRGMIDLYLGAGRITTGTLSRRNLLQLGAAAASGLLSGVSPNLMAQQRAKGSRVIVVGAGFSGLACGYELASVGYDVHVFEARDRVGGRVHSLSNLISGKNVEAGGELLGSNHPHVLAYAKKFGFEFLDVSDDDVAPSPMILQGRKLKPDEVRLVSDEVDQALGGMTEDARPVVADEPWNTPGAEHLDRLSTADWIKRLRISDLAKVLMAVQLTGTNGVTPDQQSYLGNLTSIKGGGLEKYWSDTEVYRLKGGNQKYALQFARELGPTRVTLNCPIHEISATENQMTVVDAQGRTHVADDVILAVPPSVWSMIKFTPALPSVLKPQMGQNVKYLAVVKDRFWKANQLPADATTDGTITQVWEGTDGQGDKGQAAMVAFTGGPAAAANHALPESERESVYLKAF
ncbi:MAG: puo 2, partial [Planctomycetaceae bacterium]|nr:puo 2 [Planctomycetaceae bacterium]